METLDTTGFLLTETAGEWSVLSADFGDGFEAAALVGDPTGTRTWTITIEVLPDSTDQVPTIPNSLEPAYLLTEDGGHLLLESGGRIVLESAATRANYLWKFFRISKAAGNQPFWIEVDDPDDGQRKRFLASFIDNKLTYTILCAKIYSTGLQLKQRRLPNVVSPIAP